MDAQKLVEFLSQNVQIESRLLYPDPAQFVFLESLLTHLVEEQGLTHEQMEEWWESCR